MPLRPKGLSLSPSASRVGGVSIGDWLFSDPEVALLE